MEYISVVGRSINAPRADNEVCIRPLRGNAQSAGLATVCRGLEAKPRFCASINVPEELRSAPVGPISGFGKWLLADTINQACGLGQASAGTWKRTLIGLRVREWRMTALANYADHSIMWSNRSGMLRRLVYEGSAGGWCWRALNIIFEVARLPVAAKSAANVGPVGHRARGAMGRLQSLCPVPIRRSRDGRQIQIMWTVSTLHPPSSKATDDMAQHNQVLRIICIKFSSQSGASPQGSATQGA